jgi:hypothetical protein
LAKRNWRDISYLQLGDARQQQAFAVLDELHLLDRFWQFDPVLVGTLPISIHLPASDLDIICYASDLDFFAQLVEALFRAYPAFRLKQKEVRHIPSVIVYFEHGGFGIELFAQPVPTEQQHAFRHMLIEEQLLQRYGAKFRQQVLALKRQGYKTEPAFAKLLGITGDPYLQLLDLE